ncbi:ankyrin repeat-containing domain protein [Aspergillus pseudoustus]|uniref:Ankyrin repeat-containing domain protein n=1 Tax=Aspergillus pseudoustus TaxID=1810923 RepID=A0ABR4IJJ8_9EURO
MLQLLDIPPECILDIADQLRKDSDVGSFALTNKYLYSILNRYLYRRAVRFPTRTRRGRLYYSIHTRNLNAVQHWIDAGVDLNARAVEPGSFTPLVQAVEARTGWLLPKHVCAAPEKYGNQYVRMAIKAVEDLRAICELLLANGAKVDRRSVHGWTAVHRAIVGCDDEMVKLLVAAGANVRLATYERSTPLHLAASQRDNRDTVEFLLDRGACRDLHSRTPSGDTPLHIAAYHGNIPAVGLLLDRRAEIDALDNLGWTPLHRLVEHYRVWVKSDDRDAYWRVMRLLLERGADASTLDNYGMTPLGRALTYHHPVRMVHLLLMYGARVSVTIPNGQKLSFSWKHQPSRVLPAVQRGMRGLKKLVTPDGLFRRIKDVEFQTMPPKLARLLVD